MALKYFLPDREFSWEELRHMSAKKDGKATWPTQMLMQVRRMGFDVALIEAFDAEAFARDGEHYLRSAFGSKTAEWQIANSDIPDEQRLYQEFLASGADYAQRVPTLADIEDFLQRGYLTVAVVNSRKLNNRPGYVGHFVLLYAIDEENVTFQDPGPPHRERRTESREHFESAWADPSEQAKNLIAIRYKEPIS